MLPVPVFCILVSKFVHIRKVKERSEGGLLCEVRLTANGSVEELEAVAALGDGGHRRLDGFRRELGNSSSELVVVYSTF